MDIYLLTHKKIDKTENSVLNYKVITLISYKKIMHFLFVSNYFLAEYLNVNNL